MNLQPTVLVVDDEKHTRDGLRRLLENDYDVYVAADIAGATDVLERDQVDLLLVDDLVEALLHGLAARIPEYVADREDFHERTS